MTPVVIVQFVTALRGVRAHRTPARWAANQASQLPTTCQVLPLLGTWHGHCGPCILHERTRKEGRNRRPDPLLRSPTLISYLPTIPSSSILCVLGYLARF